jgi:hypothetical protein
MSLNFQKPFQMKAICFITILISVESYASNLDSLYRHTISVGSYTTYFKDMHYHASSYESLYVTEPRRGIGLGYDYFKALTKRKSVGVSCFISNSICSYYYVGSGYPSVTGKINFNILSISPQFKYYVFKWFDIRLGIPISYVAVDKFEHPEVAKAVGWYNAEGKSTFRKPYLSYLIALDFNIYKRIGASISIINGFTPAGTVTKQALGPKYTYKEELVSGYITLNYRIR